MAFIYIAITCITILYVILILSFLIGWIRIKEYQRGQIDPSLVNISLIVAVKNEEKNISKLLNSLLNQTLNDDFFEIILVNDHSKDNTLKIVRNFIQKTPNLRVLSLPNNESGKKQAIKHGVASAKGNLIVTTDADCTHSRLWLETLSSFYYKFKPKLIILPVLMKAKNSFEKMQALDFFALMASGAGASGINKAIMCNGANLAFEKEVYFELSDPHNNKYSSGDDIFLLLNVKKRHRNKILFLKSTDAIAFTKAERTFKKFLQQRIRWASKSSGYRDSEIIATSLIVLLVNLSLLLNLVSAILVKELVLVFLIQFTAKSVIDFVFLSKTSNCFGIKTLLWYFISTQFANVFLIPYLAFVGIGKSAKWKV